MKMTEEQKRNLLDQIDATKNKVVNELDNLKVVVLKSLSKKDTIPVEQKTDLAKISDFDISKENDDWFGI